MTIQQLSLVFTGGTTNPSAIFERINIPFKKGFHLDSNLDDDISETTICVLHPKNYGYTGNIESYNEWFVNFLENEFEGLSDLGLKTVELKINLYYSGEQCSTEILDAKSLQKLNAYNISMPLDVHKLHKEELIKMLEEEQFERETYIDLV